MNEKHHKSRAKPHDSHSDVQQTLENEVRCELSKIIRSGDLYEARKIAIEGGSIINIDAVANIDGAGVLNQVVVVEIYCHLGPLKASQRKKMVTDAAKLSLVKADFLNAAHSSRVRKFIVLAGDASNMSGLGANSWHAQFLKASDVEFRHHMLTEDQQSRLRTKNDLQRKGNSTTSSALEAA